MGMEDHRTALQVAGMNNAQKEQVSGKNGMLNASLMPYGKNYIMDENGIPRLDNNPTGYTGRKEYTNPPDLSGMSGLNPYPAGTPVPVNVGPIQMPDIKDLMIPNTAAYNQVPMMGAANQKQVPNIMSAIRGDALHNQIFYTPPNANTVPYAAGAGPNPWSIGTNLNASPEESRQVPYQSPVKYPAMGQPTVVPQAIPQQEEFYGPPNPNAPTASRVPYAMPNKFNNRV